MVQMGALFSVREMTNVLSNGRPAIRNGLCVPLSLRFPPKPRSMVAPAIERGSAIDADGDHEHPKI